MFFCWWCITKNLFTKALEKHSLGRAFQTFGMNAFVGLCESWLVICVQTDHHNEWGKVKFEMRHFPNYKTRRKVLPSSLQWLPSVIHLPSEKWWQARTFRLIWFPPGQHLPLELQGWRAGRRLAWNPRRIWRSEFLVYIIEKDLCTALHV